MPKLNDMDMEERTLPTGSYGYSAAKLENLGASEYTLVTLVVDESGSVSDFQKEMEDCIKEVINACRLSPRADNLMIRLVCFHDKLREIHGFKLLENCNPDDYNDCLEPGGVTALYDAAENAITASMDYGRDLTQNDFSVNGIVIVITDGADNDSSMSEISVKNALAKIVQTEAMESLVSILVGVGVKQYHGVSTILNNFHKTANFTQFVEMENASAKTLAKLAEFVSKSISAQSQSLGTGGPSKSVPLSI
jgi:uncharacterized protein YegL